MLHTLIVCRSQITVNMLTRVLLRRGAAVSVGRLFATSVPTPVDSTTPASLNAEQPKTVHIQSTQLKAEQVRSLHLERMKVAGTPWKEGGYQTFAEAEPGAAAQAARGKVHARNLFLVFLLLVFAYRFITESYDLSEFPHYNTN